MRLAWHRWPKVLTLSKSGRLSLTTDISSSRNSGPDGDAAGERNDFDCGLSVTSVRDKAV